MTLGSENGELKKAKGKSMFVFLLPGTVLFILVVAWIYLYFWNNSQASSIVQNKIKSAQIAEQVSHLVELKSQSQQAEDIKSQLDSILPGKDDILLIPNDIKTLGQANGMSVNFTFGQEIPATASTPHYIGFSLSSQGTAPELFNFLKQSEKLPYFLDFETISASDIGAGSLQINSVGRIYLK